jgi:hypothetical protein
MKQLIFLFTLLVMFSCKKETNTPILPLSDFYYEETQCADAWCQADYANCKTAAGVSKYLTEKLNISFIDLTISDGDPGMVVCAACICPSARIIRLKSNDEDKLLKAGFKKG